MACVSGVILGAGDVRERDDAHGAEQQRQDQDGAVDGPEAAKGHHHQPRRRRQGDGEDQRLRVHRPFLQGNEQHGRELKEHHRRQKQARVRAHQRLAHALDVGAARSGRGRVEAGSASRPASGQRGRILSSEVILVKVVVEKEILRALLRRARWRAFSGPSRHEARGARDTGAFAHRTRRVLPRLGRACRRRGGGAGGRARRRVRPPAPRSLRRGRWRR